MKLTTRNSRARCLFAPLLLLAGIAPMAQASESSSRASSHDGAFPFELAFTAHSFPNDMMPVASPSGDKVAYVVIAPPAGVSRKDRFLPSGTPHTVAGASLHVAAMDARTPSATDAVCAGKGNQWSPAWSPDGRQLAFYSDADGRVRLWAYDLTTGACRRVSDAIVRGSVFSGSEPRWSPDGATLYVPLDPDPSKSVLDGDASIACDVGSATKDRSKPQPQPIVHYGGGEGGDVVAETSKSGPSQALMMRYYSATLAAVSLRDGRVRTLVPAADETRPRMLDRSPSGRWISYASISYLAQDVGTDYVADLRVLPEEGGKPLLIAKGMRMGERRDINYWRLDYRWHPAQDRLFYLKDGGLWEVDFDAGNAHAPRRLASELGELAPDILYFTRDGKAVVVAQKPTAPDRGSVPHALAIVPLSEGMPARLGLPDSQEWQLRDLVRANENSLWQPDARAFDVVVRERKTGEQAIMRLEIASGRRTEITKGPNRIGGFASGGDHSMLAAIYEDIATPPNLYRYSASLNQERQLSVIDPRLQGRRYGSAVVMEVPVPLHDGTLKNVRTTVLLPPGARKGGRLPGIVMVYSGSDLSVNASRFGGGEGNTVPSQVFTSRGYAVIMASIGLSPEGSPGQPAGQMTDEVLAQAYAVAAAGYVDIGRMAVSGQSYGGYSTAAIVSHTRLFRAGIPVNGLFDLGNIYGGMDDSGDSWLLRWAETGQGRMGESLWSNPQRYIDNSPYYRIDRIRTPMLIVAGAEDSTVPNQESRKLFVGLRRLDRPVQLAIYPGEGHVISQWSTDSAVDASRRMVDFLDMHLKPADSAVEP